jgi:pimeloyl-ACP methyl ester carboxylesterase
MRPTIVLVHGAFADSTSWASVADRLQREGHPVIAAANPLRGLASDAAAISDLVRTIDGRIVLVGHSYGGAVVTNVSGDAGDIAGLVYVAGFAPDAGENCISLSMQFPGSTLGEALEAVPRSAGTTDLTIARDRFHSQFAADLPAATAETMAIAQRPVTKEALEEPTVDRPLWETLPSWFLFGEEDRNIPADLERFMAKRASARRTIAVPGGSHAVAVSHPDATAHLILEAGVFSPVAA